MAAKKRKASPRRIPTPRAVNVKVVDERIKSWIPRLAIVTGFIAFLAAGYGAYRWLGLPILVDETKLHSSIQGAETKLRTQINETETKVIGHSDKNTKEVKDDVAVAKKILDSLARKQDQSAITALELQARQLFLQRSNLMNSISSVELQLADRPNDQFLKQRKAELEAIRTNIDRETETVSSDLRRARQGN